VDDIDDFGGHLSRALAAKDWDQESLAARLRLTRQAVSTWMRGRSVPPDETIVQIERILNEGEPVVQWGLLRLAGERQRQTTDLRRREAKDLQTLVRRDRKKHVRWDQYRSLDQRVEKLEQEQAHRAVVVDPKDVQDLAGSLESFLASVRRGYQAGEEDAEILDLSIRAIDRVMSLDPSWQHFLRRKRARLYASAGRWEDALYDLQTLQRVEQSRGEDVVAQAELLVNLGQLSDAAVLLRALLLDLTEAPSHSAVTAPIDTEERLNIRFQCEHFSIWIDDYQGRYQDALGRAMALLRTQSSPGLAAVLGPANESAVWHRIGRAKVERGDRTKDIDLSAEGLRDLLKAKRLGGPDANVYQDLWIARGALASRSRNSSDLKVRAWERARAFGGYVPAHMHLVEGRLLRNHEQPIAAINQLLPGLDIWKKVHYVRGAFEISWELARSYMELGRPQDKVEAVSYLLLCERLAQRLTDPRLDSVRLYLTNFAIPWLGEHGVQDRRVALEARESAILTKFPIELATMDPT
jgi:transcriptional regulator with XRE-family HTH domain